MKSGEAAPAEVRAAAVAAVNRLLADGISRTRACELVAEGVQAHRHTVHDWWRAAHPETRPADDQARISQVADALKRARNDSDR